jgi:hypothetical protein
MYHSEHALEFNPEAETFEAEQFEFGQSEWAGESGEVFSEGELMELTAELLSISNEAEMDQFLGKLFKRAWGGIKKVGSFVGKIARPLGGILKGIAKKALPFVGSALGSFIPIPGVGTALGGALGTAVSKALEAEFQGMEVEERDFEMARRFVQLTGTAAKQAALASPGTDPVQAAKAAIAQATRLHVPSPGAAFPVSGTAGGQVKTGRWMRRGRNIIIVNC